MTPSSRQRTIVGLALVSAAVLLGTGVLVSSLEDRLLGQVASNGYCCLNDGQACSANYSISQCGQLGRLFVPGTTAVARNDCNEACNAPADSVNARASVGCTCQDGEDGKVVHCTLEATNAGTKPIDDMELTMELAQGATYVSEQSAARVYADGGAPLAQSGAPDVEAGNTIVRWTNAVAVPVKGSFKASPMLSVAGGGSVTVTVSVVGLEESTPNDNTAAWQLNDLQCETGSASSVSVGSSASAASSAPVGSAVSSAPAGSANSATSFQSAGATSSVSTGSEASAASAGPLCDLIFDADLGMPRNQQWIENGTSNMRIMEEDGNIFLRLTDNTGNAVGASWPNVENGYLHDRDWTYEIIGRSVRSDYLPNQDMGTNVLFVSDTTKAYNIALRPGKFGVAGPATTMTGYAPGRSLNFNNADRFHHYVIQHKANGAGASDDTYDVLVDDQTYLSGVRRNELYDLTTVMPNHRNKLFFGFLMGGTGEMDIAYVRFSSGCEGSSASSSAESMSSAEMASSDESAASQAEASEASSESAGSVGITLSTASEASVGLIFFEESVGSEQSVASVAAVSVCGNAVQESGEACDDGNRTNDDDCTDTCLRPLAFACTSHTECDAGLCMDRSCTACESDSQCGPGACVARKCTVDQALIAARPKGLCSNHQWEPEEECDDGNVIPGDGCSNACLLEQGRCGDGIIQKLLGEQCELPLPSALPCSSSCRFILQFCGNGEIDAGEECDTGAENSNHPEASCRTDCTHKRCGDAIVSVGEACDDGNTVPRDGCDASCGIERNAPGTLPAQVVDLPHMPGDNGGWPLAAGDQLSAPEHPPVGDTGPAAVVAMAAGAAAGWSWIRRRRS